MRHSVSNFPNILTTLNDIANALYVPVSEFFAGAKDAERKFFAAPEKAFDPEAFRIAEAFVKISDKETR